MAEDSNPLALRRALAHLLSHYDEVAKAIFVCGNAIEEARAALRLPDETTEGRPWYLYHQWGQDNDYKWYQSCHCRKCADSTAAIAKAQERATLLAEKTGAEHGR